MSHICIKCGNKRSSFNYIGERKPKFCGDCKEDIMININYICRQCYKNKALYVEINGKKPRYCEECKNGDMKHKNLIKKYVLNV